MTEATAVVIWIIITLGTVTVVITTAVIVIRVIRPTGIQSNKNC